jgi:hypothetical protein
VQNASPPRQPDLQEHAWPLVVDLDDTLTPSDTLAESVVLLLRHKPWTVFFLLAGCVNGRARLKAAVPRACARGEMLDDPLVFALKDRGSRIALSCILLAAAVAHG